MYEVQNRRHGQIKAASNQRFTAPKVTTGLMPQIFHAVLVTSSPTQRKSRRHAANSRTAQHETYPRLAAKMLFQKVELFDPKEPGS